MLCEFQVQTRSADEPMTTFVFCNQCGNRWKVSPSVSHYFHFERNLPLWVECSHFAIVSFPQFCWLCRWFQSSQHVATTLGPGSVPLQQIGAFCILWYMVHNTPYSDATVVTDGINDSVHRLSLFLLPSSRPIPIRNLCLLVLVVSQI